MIVMPSNCVGFNAGQNLQSHQMTDQTITILSLGAGVQSTALALMAERGMIEKPIAAIFSDTGDEPATVYAHLENLKSMLSFPVHTVKFGNGLGNDFLAA